MRRKSSVINLITQIFKEFSLPLILASAWTYYSLIGEKINIETILNKFGPSFFLSSWLIGQIFRVWKQNRNENALNTIEEKFRNLIDDIKARHLETIEKMEKNYETSIGNITGGNTFPYIIVTQPIGNNLSFIIHTQGIYPLFDVKITIYDQNNKKDYSKIQSLNELHSMLKGDYSLEYAILKPAQGLITPFTIPYPESEKEYLVRFNCRNGIFDATVKIIPEKDGSIKQSILVKDMDEKILKET